MEIITYIMLGIITNFVCILIIIGIFFYLFLTHKLSILEMQKHIANKKENIKYKYMFIYTLVPFIKLLYLILLCYNLRKQISINSIIKTDKMTDIFGILK